MNDETKNEDGERLLSGLFLEGEVEASQPQSFHQPVADATNRIVDISSLVDHLLSSPSEELAKGPVANSHGDASSRVEHLTPDNDERRQPPCPEEPFSDFFLTPNQPISMSDELADAMTPYMPDGQLGSDGRWYSNDQMNAMASSLQTLSTLVPAISLPKLAPIPSSSIRTPTVPFTAPCEVVAGKDTKPKHLCQKCGKVFKRAHNLKIHGRLHSGIKPYGCPFSHCEKEFRWKSSIVSHLNWHRMKRGECLPGFDGTAAGYHPQLAKKVSIKVQEPNRNGGRSLKVHGSTKGKEKPKEKPRTAALTAFKPPKPEDVIETIGMTFMPDSQSVCVDPNKAGLKQSHREVPLRLKEGPKADDTGMNALFAPDIELWPWGSVAPAGWTNAPSQRSGQVSSSSESRIFSEMAAAAHAVKAGTGMEETAAKKPTEQSGQVDGKQTSTGIGEKEWRNLQTLLLLPEPNCLDVKTSAGSSSLSKDGDSDIQYQQSPFPCLPDVFESPSEEKAPEEKP